MPGVGTALLPELIVDLAHSGSSVFRARETRVIEGDHNMP